MQKISDGKRYDTGTAEVLVKKEWTTRHPNCRSDELSHERTLYRTRKGALFGYRYDEIGYSTHPVHGGTGAYVRKEEDIDVLPTETAAIGWAEVHELDPGEVAAKLPVEDA